MNHPAAAETPALNALRQLGGVATSAELQARLGVSQPTVSRLLAPLVRNGQVLKVGAARSQRYLLPRHVDGVGSSVPIRELDEQGHSRPFVTLVPLAGGRFWMEEDHGTSALHDDLPWFLYDLRPQGFLGRGFSQQHPELELPTHIGSWNSDHILKALVHAGDDLPGNLVVGQPALERLAARAPHHRANTVSDPAEDYPRLARQALGSAFSGSSAGGEQPKFSAVRNGHPVLVKFSSAGDSPAEQRWRDLLLCECLALHTLSKAGVAAAATHIVQAGGRVFLESRRFDRTTQGRRGMVSLEVYDAHYIGVGTNWAATAQRVDRAGADRLSTTDVRTLCLLDAYGALIANTDRHHGNISLLLQNDQWQLAPAYDMLPMLYAPINSEVPERQFAPRPLPPSAHADVWPQARTLALRFWQAAAEDERISSDFRALAQANHATVQRLG
jgi:hypothetical protein